MMSFPLAASPSQANKNICSLLCAETLKATFFALLPEKVINVAVPRENDVCPDRFSDANGTSAR